MKLLEKSYVYQLLLALIIVMLCGLGYQVYEKDRAFLLKKIEVLESRDLQPVVYHQDMMVYRDLVLRMGQSQYLERLKHERDYASIQEKVAQSHHCKQEASTLISQLLHAEPRQAQSETFFSQLVSIEAADAAWDDEKQFRQLLLLAYLSSEAGFLGWQKIRDELVMEGNSLQLPESKQSYLEQLIALPVEEDNHD